MPSLKMTIIIAISFVAAPGDYILQDGSHCSVTGTAKSTAAKDLNRHKNRGAPPAPEDIDHVVTLSAMLAPGDDTDRFDEERGATVSGFVIDVKKGGKETCNCGADDPIDMDTHIELAISADATEIERVIVEVTPRIRKQMAANDLDWSTEALAGKFRGKWVTVTGWLAFDSMHIDAAENTNPGGDRNWRATCWEIHPVTSIAATAEPAGLREVARAHAAIQKHRQQQVKQSPEAAQAITARHAVYLGRFKREELAEKDEELEANRPASARK